MGGLLGEGISKQGDQKSLILDKDFELPREMESIGFKNNVVSKREDDVDADSQNSVDIPPEVIQNVDDLVVSIRLRCVEALKGYFAEIEGLIDSVFFDADVDRDLIESFKGRLKQLVGGAYAELFENGTISVDLSEESIKASIYCNEAAEKVLCFVEPLMAIFSRVRLLKREISKRLSSLRAEIGDLEKKKDELEDIPVVERDQEVRELLSRCRTALDDKKIPQERRNNRMYHSLTRAIKGFLSGEGYNYDDFKGKTDKLLQILQKYGVSKSDISQLSSSSDMRELMSLYIGVDRMSDNGDSSFAANYENVGNPWLDNKGVRLIALILVILLYITSSPGVEESAALNNKASIGYEVEKISTDSRYTPISYETYKSGNDKKDILYTASSLVVSMLNSHRKQFVGDKVLPKNGIPSPNHVFEYSIGGIKVKIYILKYDQEVTSQAIAYKEEDNGKTEWFTKYYITRKATIEYDLDNGEKFIKNFKVDTYYLEPIEGPI